MGDEQNRTEQEAAAQKVALLAEQAARVVLSNGGHGEVRVLFHGERPVQVETTIRQRV